MVVELEAASTALVVAKLTGFGAALLAWVEGAVVVVEVVVVVVEACVETLG